MGLEVLREGVGVLRVGQHPIDELCRGVVKALPRLPLVATSEDRPLFRVLYRCVAPVGWTAFQAPDLDNLHFADLGTRVLAAAGVTTAASVPPTCRLVPVRQAVDLADRFLRRTRA
ncbi:hypothetical protein [Kitasatospora sp. NPDC001683]